MHVAAFDATLSALAFLCGAVCASLVVWLGAARSARAVVVSHLAAAGTFEARLANARVEAATARAGLNAARERVVEIDRESALQRRATEAALTRAKEAECALASALGKIEQMKAGEADVEARLQRVAASYVNEARDVLLQAASERFAGDANAFRERMAASVEPLSNRIVSLDKSLGELGATRMQDQERVATLLEGLNAKMSGIDDATRRVERVLGNSQARGSWGEFELKRLLELTGMTEHVDFETQRSGYGTDATGRPDVVVRIPGNRTVPIDAKVPFARYQDAVAAASEAEREPLLDEAVAAMRAHVKVLAARKYHDTPACIGWTVMFVPIEAMLATLFARDRDIFEVARVARVLIASPLTLMLYLEAFSREWAAQKQSENAAAILCDAKELVVRLGRFTERFAKVGSSLNGAIDKYNEAVGSYELRLAPQTKKIAQLSGDLAEPAALGELNVRARVLDETRIPPRLSLTS